jgi:hypothetical protein
MKEPVRPALSADPAKKLILFSNLESQGAPTNLLRWTPNVRQPEPLLRCSPAEFEVGPDRSYRDRRFDASTFHLINIKSCVGCGACGYMGEGEHFPASELAREGGEAQPVGEADRPHIHRPSW